MSTQHKAALAVGREEGRVVRRYLEALVTCKPKRGRKKTVESIELRLKQIDGRLAVADPLARVHLLQERLDLQSELDNRDAVVDLEALEDQFVGVASAYGERKGLSYAAWREAGVSASTLRRAGIRRGGAARLTS